MKINVTTLHTRNNPGVEPTVHATEDAARDVLYVEVASSWDNLWCPDGQDCDVTDCAGVPDTPDGFDRDTAIATYFDHRTEDRPDIIDHEVDIPLTDLLGDWVTRAQHEVDMSYAEPRQPTALRTLIEELLSLDNPHNGQDPPGAGR